MDHVLRQQQSLDATPEMGVFWGNVVETSRGGRVRIALDDGSILNAPESHLRPTQHDPAAGRTWLELLYGRVRASVTKIAGPKLSGKGPASE